MATKKPPRSTKKKLAKKSTEKNFVLRFHSSLDGENNSWGSPMFYSESGQGWVADIGSATRYSESGADGRILQLLKEDKIASEMVDLNVKPDNIFSINTALLDDKNIPQVITKVPHFAGDTYHLVPAGVSWLEEDLVEVLRHNDFSILWDPEKSEVPEDTESWLYELIGEPCEE